MSSEIYPNPCIDRLLKFSAPGAEPMDFHKRLPGYQQTPLHSITSVAHELGISKFYVKDESLRLGLPAFKILGASWATYRELIERQPELKRAWNAVEEFSARIKDKSSLMLVAATDGNHGRAVARTAKLLGLKARIFVPEGTALARINAIQSEGAEVIVVDGTYDDAVSRATTESHSNSCIHIQDNSWEGYEQVARFVIEGYSTLLREIDGQLGEMNEPVPTHVIVQLGNGSFADAVIRHYSLNIPRPVIIGVEPQSAACLLESVKAGERVKIPGPHTSIMVGMNCDSPSLISFPIIQTGMDCFTAIPDESARKAMRLLNGANIISGETGSAGLAALLELADDESARKSLGLTAASCVLVFSTEGATDPVSYDAIIRSASAIKKN